MKKGGVVRQEFINSAIRVAATKGLHNVTTKALSADSGLSEGYIYRYFKSKEDLLKETFFSLDKELSYQLSCSFKRIDNQVTDVREGFQTIFHDFWRFCLADRNKCTYYIQYYYSNYYESILVEERKKIYRELLKMISPVFRKETDVWDELSSIYDIVFSKLLRILRGTIEDNKKNEEETFSCLMLLEEKKIIFEKLSQNKPKGEGKMAQIAEIIKYEGDNSTFIWKHPLEDFNSLTQLIVHESQEAIFFMNGQALDLFGPGRYTLETQNIPFLGKLLNRSTGGNTPFHCEVYFVNKTVQMAIRWGTDSKVRFIEPTMGIPLEIGACGEMNLAVSDSRKLLVKLVGTMKGIAWSSESDGFTKSLQNSFRPLISTAVKANLASSIKKQNIDIVEIDEHLEVLSEELRKSILPGFEEYGLTVPQFYLTTVLLPENDPNFRRMKELHTIALQTRMFAAEALVKSAQADADATVTAARRKVEMEKQTTETEIAKREAERKLIEAQAEAQKTKMSGFAEAEVMKAKGYTEKDVLSAEVQKAYAEGIGNMGGGTGGGGVVSDIVGLGVGLAAAGNVSSQFGDMFKGFQSNGDSDKKDELIKCAKCGADLPKNAKFCLECGEKIISPDSVICPECGKTVPKGKFCPECGHKFISNCPKCGAQIPEGSKFCLECGEKI